MAFVIWVLFKVVSLNFCWSEVLTYTTKVSCILFILKSINCLFIICVLLFVVNCINMHLGIASKRKNEWVP